MKLLLIYCDNFSYNPTIRTLEDAEHAVPAAYSKVQTAFIQVEEEDEQAEGENLKKALKNIKWVCGKNGTKHIVLHSFAHLSESKASPAFTKDVFDALQERLESAGYNVAQTPFGYFLDLHVDAPGFSLARVFKSI